MAKVLICKSTNESTGNVVKYPIRYGRLNGKSIWVEREIVDLLLMWGYMEKKGSWFTFDEEVSLFLEKEKIKAQTKFQGIASIQEYLEKNKDVTSCLKVFVEQKILSQ